MIHVTDSIRNAPRSGIRTLMELSASLEGPVVHCEVGEPQFETPAHIIEAACQALRSGYTKYNPNAGLTELREAIAKAKSKDLGIPLTKDNIMIGIGGIEILQAVIRAFMDPGDEILMPDPYWPNYIGVCATYSIKPVLYKLLPENGFYPDMEELEKLISPRTKMIMVNSPSNPLGIVFPKEVMEKLVDFADRHDIVLLSDEAYEKMVFDCEMFNPQMLGMRKNVIAAHTLSKTYSMTGWRVGYMIAHEDVVNDMFKMQENYISCVPTALQKASVAAIEGPQDCVDMMRNAYKEHRDVVANILRPAGIQFLIPTGAFYMWVNVETEDSDQFCVDFLMKERVAVAPGSTFGPSGQGWIRISLASSAEDLEQCAKRLVRFLGK